MTLEKRGVATVTLTTNEFESLARLQARAMGFPDLRIITIQHPLGGITPAEAEAKAVGTIDQVVRLITGESA